jgi:hypothetical protein
MLVPHLRFSKSSRIRPFSRVVVVVATHIKCVSVRGAQELWELKSHCCMRMDEITFSLGLVA